jgi:predicted RNA binding protein YcfA (HicA-like mRNA interferase family)
VREEPKLPLEAVQETNGTGRETAGELFKGKLLSQKKAVKLLEEHGWTLVAGGKHVVKMKKPGCRPITLPKHKGQDYGKGLTAKVLKQAGLA